MKTLFLICAIFLSFASVAQLNTFPGNVGFVINSGFLGPNYSVTNVQYTGHPQAVGSFISDSSNLGLTKGVLLTTGLIYGNGGPQGPNDLFSASYSNGYSGTSFIQNSIDAAVLEFDILSNVDTIEFRYVFGSEEYPESIGSQYIDQFHILLSGPGILLYDTINRLPNGDLVGINTVNAAMNASYYVSNGNGNQAPYNQSDYYIQYNGFTVPLTAKVGVTAFQTYHITFVIADVTDPVYDSGLFLEQCDGCNYNASVQSWSTSKITCFPNPSDGNVSVEFPELTSAAELRVINHLGEVIKRIEVKSGAKIHSINDLPSGSYILEIISKSAIWTGKLAVN